MKLKSLLPWLCVLGLLIGLVWMYAANQKTEAELALLREDSQELQRLRAEVEESKATRTQAESAELTRLRKDNEDLRRLRNEVGQLRAEKQQLSAQVQKVQAQVQGAQAQVEALRASPGQAGSPVPLTAVAQAVSTARSAQPPPSPEQAQAAACIGNLRLIDGAKHQWALEKQKPAGALLTATDLAPYMRSNTVPACPAGGVYTLNPVGLTPLCNLPGHAVPK
jgi:hypothetical protein